MFILVLAFVAKFLLKPLLPKEELEKLEKQVLNLSVQLKKLEEVLEALYNCGVHRDSINVVLYEKQWKHIRQLHYLASAELYG